MSGFSHKQVGTNSQLFAMLIPIDGDQKILSNGSKITMHSDLFVKSLLSSIFIENG
jgi:hypothetical protein